MQCGHDTDRLKRLAMASDLSYQTWLERGSREWQHGSSHLSPLFGGRHCRIQSTVIIPRRLRMPGRLCQRLLLHKAGLANSFVDCSPIEAQLAKLKQHTVPSRRRALKRNLGLLRLYKDSQGHGADPGFCSTDQSTPDGPLRLLCPLCFEVLSSSVVRAISGLS